ncbi:GTPase [Aquisphaera insulae]|uniref:GTPase n=1 Tax=Aquisphaera insulae TaxID=2712864 RepID=UPI0013EB68C5|nr:GTPase [Aquisphaera insulae]
MPANLPPPYLKAEEEFRRASTAADRLEKLREMFRLLPKHKGTEKLQSDLKQKISRLKDEIEGSKGAAKKSGVSHAVPHDGAGQVVLVGPPNSGKSALLAALTKAHPEVAAYPFTTRAPQPGIMMWQDVPVQLVDLPPISPEFLEPWVPSLVRSADAALLVADLSSDDVVEALDAVLQRLAATKTELVGTPPVDDEDESLRHIKTVMIANRCDEPGAEDRLAILRELMESNFPIIPASAQGGQGLESVRDAAYHLLGVFRVYTKVPGKPVDRSRPFTLPMGSIVLDLAREIHRDFEQTLKSARVWGSGAFDGQTVKRDHELQDGDVVELHVT